MSEHQNILILGLYALVPVVAGFIFKFSNEITQIKTVMSAISKRAAEILHSPDDHHKLDALIERFSSGDLEKEERQQFVKLLGSLEKDANADKSERLLALLASMDLMVAKKNAKE